MATALLLATSALVAACSGRTESIAPAAVDPLVIPECPAGADRATRAYDLAPIDGADSWAGAVPCPDNEAPAAGYCVSAAPTVQSERAGAGWGCAWHGAGHAIAVVCCVVPTTGHLPPPGPMQGL